MIERHHPLKLALAKQKRSRPKRSSSTDTPDIGNQADNSSCIRLEDRANAPSAAEIGILAQFAVRVRRGA
jgi:hypothetical protein